MPVSADRPQPVVPIKKSVTPEYIVCLEDGKKLKMLKRHLKTAYDMSPEEYRERWGLPADYPMVAPNYAKQRSRLAKDIGLGTKSKAKSINLHYEDDNSLLRALARAIVSCMMVSNARPSKRIILPPLFHSGS